VDPRIIVLGVVAVLLVTRLRWTVLAAWLAGMGAAWVGDDAGPIRLLLVMGVCEGAAAALVRGGLVAAVVGAGLGQAAFFFVVPWHEGRMFLALLAASGAVGATLGACATGSRPSGRRRREATPRRG